MHPRECKITGGGFWYGYWYHHEATITLPIPSEIATKISKETVAGVAWFFGGASSLASARLYLVCKLVLPLLAIYTYLLLLVYRSCDEIVYG